MNTRPQKPSVILVGALCLAIAGCSAKQAQRTPQPRGASISLRGIAFVPAEVTISTGEAVTWKNEEAVEHTVTSGTSARPDGQFDQALQMGDAFPHAFQTPGVVPFFCRRHPANMTGTVTVR